MHFNELDKRNLISRRNFLIKAGLVCSTVALGTRNLLAFSGPKKNVSQRIGIAKSLKEEYEYYTKIEGEVPKGINGFLYRNGPGIFDRNGLSRNTILDGDGMIQSFQFKNGKVHYKNKFVRTKKFLEEEKKGRFLYSTWTTKLDKRPSSQAGVTVIERNNKLYAFDEYDSPYILSPKNLKTIEQKPLQPKQKQYQAHTKIDPKNGDWITFGLTMAGLNRYYLSISVLDRKNKVKKYISYKLDNNYYLHDFHVTENYIILDIQPAYFDLEDFFEGKRSLVGTLQWNKKQSNKLYIFDRHGKNEKPFIIDIEDSYWCWHHANAYESKGEIILDSCIYNNPYHFIKPNGLMSSIMKNQPLNRKLSNFDDMSGTSYLCRRIVNLNKKKVRKENLFDKKIIEFPITNLASNQTLKHRYIYASLGFKKNRFGFFEGLAKIDTKTGNSFKYSFGAENYVGEPIFVPKKNFNYQNKKEPGYLLSLVYNAKTDKSFLAIFDAQKVDKGPIAKAHLKHYSPLSFHGYWSQA